MNGQHRAIRARLSEMGPVQAEQYIRTFDLHEDEALYIIEREAKRRSIQQIAAAHNVSVETVKRRRKSGFYKMGQQMA